MCVSNLLIIINSALDVVVCLYGNVLILCIVVYFMLCAVLSYYCDLLPVLYCSIVLFYHYIMVCLPVLYCSITISWFVFLYCTVLSLYHGLSSCIVLFYHYIMVCLHVLYCSITVSLFVFLHCTVLSLYCCDKTSDLCLLCKNLDVGLYCSEFAYSSSQRQDGGQSFSFCDLLCFICYVYHLFCFIYYLL